MGQSKSKQNQDLSKATHFSKNEINVLRSNVKEKDQDNITEDVFKDSVKQCVPSVSNNDDVFLKRLFAAFGGNEDKSIDFSEFVDGLSIFIKGTPEEKLKLSFKLYDLDKDGYISKEELEKVMLQLSQVLSKNEDQSEEIQNAIDFMFQDFDLDGDGKLSFNEYKLSAIKEPLVADFIEGFLDQHNLSQKPKILSRPASVASEKSLKASNKSQHRLSVKLSQAELLDYSHQQQVLNLSESTTPTYSPRNSLYLQPLTPVESPDGSNSESATPPMNSPTTKRHRLSRGTSMASLDAAMVSL